MYSVLTKIILGYHSSSTFNIFSVTQKKLLPGNTLELTSCISSGPLVSSILFKCDSVPSLKHKTPKPQNTLNMQYKE